MIFNILLRSALLFNEILYILKTVIFCGILSFCFIVFRFNFVKKFQPFFVLYNVIITFVSLGRMTIIYYFIFSVYGLLLKSCYNSQIKYKTLRAKTNIKRSIWNYIIF